MASIVVNRGLQVIGKRASNITGGTPTTGHIQTMVVDSKSTAFAAGDTTIAASTKVAKAFDSTPTISSQTVTHVTTYTTAQGNFIIRRVSLHNLAAGSVSSGSSGLICGVDGQSITKTTAFTLAITMKLSYTSS